MDMPDVVIGTEDGLHTLGVNGRPKMGGHSVDHIAVTAGDIWAVSDGRTVWHDSGTGEWSSVVQLAEDRANCLLVTEDRTLVGAGGASLIEVVDGELSRVESFDRAPGREAWYTPWGEPPDVRSMARGVEGTLYVNVHVGGIVRSLDEGRTWTETVDIESDVHQVVADPDRSEHAYAASARGLALTTDGADKWEFIDEGLGTSYCRAVALSAASVYVSVSLGPGGHRSALYRRPLGSGVFQRCVEGLPEWFSDIINTFCLAARDQFVVVGDADGTVYASLDDGATWQMAAEGLPGIRCLAIV